MYRCNRWHEHLSFVLSKLRIEREFGQRFFQRSRLTNSKSVNKMEAIPITNCSSTLPSLSRGVIPSKRLCRNLFGPVDHEEVKSVLDQELIEDQQQKCEEWCFNFSEGTPILNGRLVWEEIAERKEYVLSPEPQKPVSEERRVPNLHEEQESKDKDVFDKPQKAVVRPTTKKSPEIVKTSPAVTNETEANKLKVPSTPDRKRKKQYKTITGKCSTSEKIVMLLTQNERSFNRFRLHLLTPPIYVTQMCL